MAVSANGKTRVKDWDDDKEVVPKAIWRAASGIRAFTDRLAAETWTDINLGLDYLTTQVNKYWASDNERYEDIRQWLSIRRGGRGVQKSLTPEGQLLLWEILAQESKIAIGQPRRRSHHVPQALSVSEMSAQGRDSTSGQHVLKFSSEWILDEDSISSFLAYKVLRPTET